MNFWKVFRWVSTALFIALILLALLTNGSGSPSSGGDEPPPAPVFR